MINGPIACGSQTGFGGSTAAAEALLAGHVQGFVLSSHSEPGLLSGGSDTQQAYHLHCDSEGHTHLISAIYF
jgi:hypothetical protein